MKIIKKTVCGYPAWRVQDGKGIHKGGVRFDENVTLEEVISLAKTMTKKCEFYGLPFVGGKGAVKVDPYKLSPKELEGISREYIRQFREYVGPDKDVLACDMGTTPEMMDWMADEHGSPLVCTSKNKDGLEGRAEATGYGGYVVMRKYPSIKTIAIQGKGNVGSHFKEFAEREYEIVAQTDKESGQFFNKELLELNVDCLVLAACENQITKDNVKDIQAGIVLELANGGVSDEVKKGYHKFRLVEDYVCNAGGVVASYLEWEQNKEGKKYSKYDTFKFIRDKMGY